MLVIALREFPQLTLDTREIERGGKSYTVDTLAALRAEMPTRPLVLLVGADAFLGFPQWHRWKDLFALAHIVVIPRPGIALESRLKEPLAAEWRQRLTADPGVLRHGNRRLHLRPARNRAADFVDGHPRSTCRRRPAIG